MKDPKDMTKAERKQFENSKRRFNDPDFGKGMIVLSEGPEDDMAKIKCVLDILDEGKYSADSIKKARAEMDKWTSYLDLMKAAIEDLIWKYEINPILRTRANPPKDNAT